MMDWGSVPKVYGWLCPNCGRANAPSTPACCIPKATITPDIQIDPEISQWPPNTDVPPSTDEPLYRIMWRA